MHILELPNPDPDRSEGRPAYDKDRRTAYSVKDLTPVKVRNARARYGRSAGTRSRLPARRHRACGARVETGRGRAADGLPCLGRPQEALEAAGVAYQTGDVAGGQAIFCRDPDANTLLFTEDSSLMPIAEANDGPMVPWTRLW